MESVPYYSETPSSNSFRGPGGSLKMKSKDRNRHDKILLYNLLCIL